MLKAFFNISIMLLGIIVVLMITYAFLNFLLNIVGPITYILCPVILVLIAKGIYQSIKIIQKERKYYE